MSRYLLDTNHASLLFRQLPSLRARVQAAQGSELLLCRPSIGELWFMVYNSGKVRVNVKDLRDFLGHFRSIEFGAKAAGEFGRIKTELRKLGRPIPDVDAQIAAIARIHGLILLTADGHFGWVSGLKTENWLK